MDRISEISYMFFRNLRNLSSWVLNDIDVLVINGENQQGKTNLLEAIYSALTGESFRTSSIGDIITHGRKQAMSSVVLSSDKILRFVVTRQDNGSVKSEWFLNDKKMPKKDNPYRYRAVHFLRIEADKIMVPSEFTRMLMRLMLRIHSDFRKEYTEYMAWVRKRNELLKSQSFDAHILKIVDRKKLIPLCHHLRNMRHKYIRNMITWINQKLEIEMPGLSVNIQEKNRVYGVPLEIERDRGSTLWGIHRDKLYLELMPMDKSVPTQGVQVFLLFLVKMALLVQKPAISRYYFFLDDIGWELDKHNFSRILKHMTAIGQVFFASPWWHSEVEGYLGHTVKVERVIVRDGKLL